MRLYTRDMTLLLFPPVTACPNRNNVMVAERKRTTDNNWVNETEGSSVALIASKFSGRRWLPCAIDGASSYSPFSER
jgi:hypothetical protein